MNLAASKPALIGVDWGASSLRAFLIGTQGEVIEGDAAVIKRQKDVWTFARIMGSDDPNWELVATGE